MVGCMSTLTHILVFVLLMETVISAPLVANVLAFLLAMLVSFYGHFKWTFREYTIDLPIHRAHWELFRFTISALLGISINSLIVWFFTSILQLNYMYALLPVAILTPLLLFLIGHYWVFSNECNQHCVIVREND